MKSGFSSQKFPVINIEKKAHTIHSDSSTLTQGDVIKSNGALKLNPAHCIDEKMNDGKISEKNDFFNFFGLKTLALMISRSFPDRGSGL